MFGLRTKRHARWRAQPFPAEWADILRRNVPYIRSLTTAERRELEGQINIFLREKYFVGCNGLQINDEIRVTIAAQACLLTLSRPDTDLYRSLKTIYVYPDRFITPQRQPDGTIIEDANITLGQSWTRGPVVVSWRDALRGAADPADGHNVVLHEFAHQLDAQDGATNGAPALRSRSMYAAWSRIFAREYRDLHNDLLARDPNLMGAYAATSPAEFFAVATERFFERPRDLQRQSPELYEQLKQFYMQDPAKRFTTRP
ncbi:MAG: zinc-dependent peptidase [Phycisphaeraceae bacterium]|nr:zinc-dependent peptidase [Phycisphaeraceae bacterium]MCB9847174.1 zinc-dependent peptidase [Phycisphaeraceae bacterium]